MFPNGTYVLEGDGCDGCRPLGMDSDRSGCAFCPGNNPTAAPAASTPGLVCPTRSRPPQQLYRWIDAEGVANWTINWEAVPEKYRSEATPVVLNRRD